MEITFITICSQTKVGLDFKDKDLVLKRTFEPNCFIFFCHLLGGHVCRSHFHQPGSGTKHLPGRNYSAAHYSSLYSNRSVD